MFYPVFRQTHFCPFSTNCQKGPHFPTFFLCNALFPDSLVSPVWESLDGSFMFVPRVTLVTALVTSQFALESPYLVFSGPALLLLLNRGCPLFGLSLSLLVENPPFFGRAFFPLVYHFTLFSFSPLCFPCRHIKVYATSSLGLCTSFAFVRDVSRPQQTPQEDVSFSRSVVHSPTPVF